MMAKQPRADARRNRARVLEVAAEVFATEGLSVPVHEIARRAGVGTGTVSRHFPTKQELFAAILLQRLDQLTRQAEALAEEQEPGAAFFTCFATLIREGAANRGLAEALAGAGYDLESAAVSAGYDVTGGLSTLLARAQEAGAVRPDVDYADVKALMTGCLTRTGSGTDAAADAVALAHLTEVVCDGLRSRTSP
ncbi:TetR family transcriptional regulator [Streptomyces sp. 846.5]|nr:TetR family transcriptional regulator [Streptomyces sp. 846.5]